jgi:hypothetical protein
MDPQKMMGFDTPGDKRVSVTVRDWNALRLALWRNRAAWEIAERAAKELLDRCEHVEGCPGKTDETRLCLGGSVWSEDRLTAEERACPDREVRMSALIILNAARQFTSVRVNKPADAPYFAPSREYFSAVMAELAAAQVELEALRGNAVVPPSAAQRLELPPPPPGLEEGETP